MIGYGPEKCNFVLELTYNYGIDGYEFGNDLQFLVLHNPSALARASLFGYSVAGDVIVGPDNYKYKILPSIAGRAEYFVAVALRSSNLNESEKYWCELLGMQSLPSHPQLTMSGESGRTITVGYSFEETALHFIQFNDNQSVNHALSGGRIAFACKSVPEIFNKVIAAGRIVQTPPLTLPTPGKADVVVTILVDPDGYEICFVEDVAFYELATPKYDTIDWTYRGQKGGDGVPLQKGRQEVVSSESAKSESVKIHIIESEEEFEEHLSHSGRVYVADFNASWCKNCKKIHPTLQSLAEQFSSSITILDIDIDDNSELAETHGVTSIPRLIAYRNGVKIDDYLGSNPEEVSQFFHRNSSVE